MRCEVSDLGRQSYDAAYVRQRQVWEQILAGRETGDRAASHILLVEHDPPVITVSRRPGAGAHLLATEEHLRSAGVTVAQTDRGGDITYHGPGQLVAYPIVDLNRHGLRIVEYLRLLEESVIETCEGFGIAGWRDTCATGVWVGDTSESASCPGLGGRKICAIGVRVERWISLHGLALNVRTDLSHFGLIVPCGLVGREVTSLSRELGDRCPDMATVKERLAGAIRKRLDGRLERPTR